MRLLPRDSFVIESREPAAELARRLAEHVEPLRSSLRRSWYAQAHQPFTGSVTDAGFDIRPFVRYRNAFLPILRGTFDEHDGGTTVHVEMGTHPFPRVFMTVWFCGVGFCAAVSLMALLTSRGGALAGLGLSAVMFLFGWALTTFGFWFEAGPARRTVEQILGGSAGPSPGGAGPEAP